MKYVHIIRTYRFFFGYRKIILFAMFRSKRKIKTTIDIRNCLDVYGFDGTKCFCLFLFMCFECKCPKKMV